MSLSIEKIKTCCEAVNDAIGNFIREFSVIVNIQVPTGSVIENLAPRYLLFLEFAEIVKK